MPADPVQQSSFPIKDGYATFGCPVCGDVYHLPVDGPDETPPWCMHNNYRWTHFPNFDPVKWAELGWVQMVRVRVVPL